MELTEDLRQEYLSLWENCQIKSSFESTAKWYADKMEAGRPKYESVSEKTGVPWYLIAIIHGMECSFSFSAHLHNGDPLTARTIAVPAGRPQEGSPPFTWEESAIDALEYDGATSINTWDLASIFWFLEGYNGWGYRTGSGRQTTPPCRSAYIYSATNHYEKGKYVRDRVFDPEAVSAQVGCMAQLKVLEQRGLVSFKSEKLDPNKVGSVGAWQHILNGCGYYPVLSINGKMDKATVAKTQKFQEDLELPEANSEQAGMVTLATWQAGLAHAKLPGWVEVVPPLTAKKNPLPLSPEEVGSVAAWQHILNGCGYQPELFINGHMDEGTIANTKKFQEDLELPEANSDQAGTVTLATWQAGLAHAKLPGWSTVVPPLTTDKNIISGTVCQKLYDFYSKRENYNKVYRKVVGVPGGGGGWFGTTTNACVAFISEALRLSGYPVPKTNLDGANISLWTVSFSKYLRRQGWEKSTDASKLQKGDVVLSEPGGFGQGVPAHVYMFAGWSNQSASVAWVIDNQGSRGDKPIETLI